MRILKILAVGDFHGKFPEKLKNKIKEINPDFILCTGDYAEIDEFRPWLKKIFKAKKNASELGIKEMMGAERYGKLLKKDYAAGKEIIKRLNSLGIKAFSVFGNGDWYKLRSSRYKVKRDYGQFTRKLRYIKNIHRGRADFKGLRITGFGGYLDNDVYFSEKGRKAISDSAEQNKIRKERYKKEEKKFASLMKSKPSILLTHYTPYRCMDRLKTKGLALSGSSMGISYFNRGIKKYKPILAVCGHMHENSGMCRIGRTLVINPGAASEGKAALIELDEKKKKIKSVKFIKYSERHKSFPIYSTTK